MDAIKQVEPLALLYVSVAYGQGSKILDVARKKDLRGGTVIPVIGTVRHPFLHFLSLQGAEKEMVLIAGRQEKIQGLMAHLNEVIPFEKAQRGLMFSLPIDQIIGSRIYQTPHLISIEAEKHKGEKVMYHLITTIVERGNAEEVIDAAQAAGAKGGTIMNGRGSGINETTRLFNMPIEPEKELVWTITPQEDTDRVVQSIRHHLAIDEPGRGVIFVQSLGQIYGLPKEG